MSFLSIKNLLVLFLILLSAALTYYLSLIKPIRIDFSREKYFTLSPLTKDILKRIEQAGEPLTILAFFKEGESSRQKIKDLFQEYEKKCSLIKAEVIDPDLKPGIAQKYAGKATNLLVYIYKDKIIPSRGISEAEISGTLLRLTSPAKRKIYFLSGHGEHPLFAGDNISSSYFKALSKLQEIGYEAKSLSLFKENQVPADCDLLVIAGARETLLETEEEAILKYLRQGGSAFFLLDPDPAPSFMGILFEFGIQVGRDLVIDPDQHLQGELFTPAISRYYIHPITNGMEITFFPAVRSISVAKSSPENALIIPLAETGPESWAEKELSYVRFDPETDQKGPITIAVASIFQAEIKDRYGRIVAVGDSDFASDKFFDVSSNSKFFLNAIEWLLGYELFSEIPPRKELYPDLMLTESQMEMIILISIFVLPFIPLLIGGIIWIWRR